MLTRLADVIATKKSAFRGRNFGEMSVRGLKGCWVSALSTRERSHRATLIPSVGRTLVMVLKNRLISGFVANDVSRKTVLLCTL